MNYQFEEPKNRWQDSILFKLGVITVIILALLIPSAWIQGLISDREGYQQKMRLGVASQWADSQLVQGPVLMLPYKQQVTETDAANKKVVHDVMKTLYVLPQALKFKASIKTEKFEKGVYDATVYNSGIDVTGDFAEPDLAALGVNEADVLYDKARLVFSITDLKGLKNNPIVKIQGTDHPAEVSVDSNLPFEKGLQVNFSLQKSDGFSFSYHLDLKGSNDLNFLYTGKTTDVEVTSDWLHPDNNGRYLPDSRVKNGKTIVEKWHMLYYNRPFPQQWSEDNSVLTDKKTNADAVFGVKLQLPIDQYRKVMRTAKYDTLIILLTFVSLFLAEMIKKQRVHVFNYILIGAAMVVYYTLLLSFSEQIGFNYAYLLSSGSTIALITIFTASLLKNRNVAILFALILSFFYGFIFIIVQLEELSLLFGSIALFAIVAALMYFSRKISWDGQADPALN